MLRLSVVIPVYNEEENLFGLIDRLDRELMAIDSIEYEIIFVDDGSVDRTAAIIADVQLSRPHISLVKLARNFGQQKAYSAGLSVAKGDFVALMDADLQDPPELLHQFVELAREGYEIVATQKESRDASWLMRLMYRSYYALAKSISSTPVELESSDFCLMSRRAVQCLCEMPEVHRYLRGMRSWLGFKTALIPFERPRRMHGHSKYTWRKLVNLALDGLFSLSTLPLKFAGLIGGMFVICSSLFAIVSIIIRIFFTVSPSGFTALVTLIAFSSGIQLLFLWVIGEYVGRIFEQTRGRPIFIIDSVSAGKFTTSASK